MKEEILQIASDLREGHITSNEAKAQLLRLFGVIGSVCPNCLMGRDEFEPEWKCPDCRGQTDL